MYFSSNLLAFLALIPAISVLGAPIDVDALTPRSPEPEPRPPRYVRYTDYQNCGGGRGGIKAESNGTTEEVEKRCFKARDAEPGRPRWQHYDADYQVGPNRAAPETNSTKAEERDLQIRDLDSSIANSPVEESSLAAREAEPGRMRYVKYVEYQSCGGGKGGIAAERNNTDVEKRCLKIRDIEPEDLVAGGPVEDNGLAVREAEPGRMRYVKYVEYSSCGGGKLGIAAEHNSTKVEKRCLKIRDIDPEDTEGLTYEGALVARNADPDRPKFRTYDYYIPDGGAKAADSNGTDAEKRDADPQPPQVETYVYYHGSESKGDSNGTVVESR